MSTQLLNDDTALRMFFTDPVFIIEDTSISPKVERNPIEVENVAIPLKNLDYIGGNKKNILLLVNDPANEISDPAGAELLKNILKYLQLRKEDFALLNVSGIENLSLQILLNQFSPRILLGFGIKPDMFQLKEEAGKQLWDINGMKIILTTDLPGMSVDNNSKKSFLALLKTIDSW